MTKKRVEAWAVLFKGEPHAYFGYEKLASNQVAVLNHDGERRAEVCHLVEADPLKERVYKAALKWGREHVEGKKASLELLRAVEAALKKKG